MCESRVARVALCGSLCAGAAYTPPLFVSAEALKACWDAARQPRTPGARKGLKLWKCLEVRTAPRARVGVYRRNRLRTALPGLPYVCYNTWQLIRCDSRSFASKSRLFIFSVPCFFYFSSFKNRSCKNIVFQNGPPWSALTLIREEQNCRDKKTLIFFFAFPVLSSKFGNQSLRFRAAKTFSCGITFVFVPDQKSLYQIKNPVAHLSHWRQFCASLNEQ